MLYSTSYITCLLISISVAEFSKILLVSIPEKDKIMFALIDKEESVPHLLQRHGTLELSDVHKPLAIAYEQNNKIVYWANGPYMSQSREIRRSSIYGGESEVLITDITSDVLAIEVHGSDLYWTQGNILYLFDGGTSESTMIFESTGNFHDIHYFDHYIYYLTKENDYIGRLKINNLNNEFLVDNSLHTDVNGLDVARNKNKMYWSTNGYTLMKTNLDTMSSTTVDDFGELINDVAITDKLLFVSSKTLACVLGLNMNQLPLTQECTSIQETGADKMLIEQFEPDDLALPGATMLLTTIHATTNTIDTIATTGTTSTQIGSTTPGTQNKLTITVEPDDSALPGATMLPTTIHATTKTIDTIATTATASTQIGSTTTPATQNKLTITVEADDSALPGATMLPTTIHATTNTIDTIATTTTTSTQIVSTIAPGAQNELTITETTWPDCTVEEIMNNNVDNEMRQYQCIPKFETFLGSINEVDDILIEKLETSNMSIYEEISFGIHFLAFQLDSNTTVQEHWINLDNNAVVFSVEVRPHTETISVAVTYLSQNHLEAEKPKVTYHSDSVLEDEVVVEYVKGSGLLSVTAYKNAEKVDASVNFSVPTFIENNRQEINNTTITPVCAFLTETLSWSSKGCYVQQNQDERNVTCSCNHLTSFIVIFEVSSSPIVEVHEVILSWITKIGMMLSSVTLGFTMIVYLVLRNLRKSLRHMIHMQLIGHIILFNILFLCGIEKTDIKNICLAVSIVLHFELLCIFTWMLSEAIFLLFKVVKKTPSKYNKFKYHLLGAYSVPVIIIVITAALGLDRYTSDNLCWLDGNGKWAAVIPAMAVLFVNVIILTKMLLIIYARAGPMTQKSEKLQTEYKQLRSTLKGILMLFPILGLTWILGLFAIFSDSLFLVYFYTILNSLQGVFIFIFYCLLDQRVKEELTKLLKRKRLNTIMDVSLNESAKPTTAFNPWI